MNFRTKLSTPPTALVAMGVNRGTGGGGTRPPQIFKGDIISNAPPPC